MSRHESILPPSLNVEQIVAAITRACSDLPVAFAYLYGSQATGQTHAKSDIDIALGFVAGTTDHVGRRVEAIKAINHVLPVDTTLLDVQDFDALPLAVRFRAVRDGRLIYCADEARQRRQVLGTIAQAQDQKPVTEQLQRAFFARASKV